MGHLLKSQSGQYIEFSIEDISGNAITNLTGLTVLVAMDNVNYFTGSGTTSVVLSKRIAYMPTVNEMLCDTFRIDVTHTGSPNTFHDVFDMIPRTDSENQVTINNSLPTLNSGKVSVNDALPTVDESGRVTISNSLPTLSGGSVYVAQPLPTVDPSGRVSISNTLPVLDGNRYVTINNTLPVLDGTNKVIASGMPTLAEIKTQVVSALSGDTYAEPGIGVPASTASLATKLNTIYKMAINKTTQDADEYKLFNSSGTVVDQKAITEYDGVTFTRNKIISG